MAIAFCSGAVNQCRKIADSILNTHVAFSSNDQSHDAFWVKRLAGFPLLSSCPVLKGAGSQSVVSTCQHTLVGSLISVGPPCKVLKGAGSQW